MAQQIILQSWNIISGNVFFFVIPSKLTFSPGTLGSSATAREMQRNYDRREFIICAYHEFIATSWPFYNRTLLFFSFIRPPFRDTLYNCRAAQVCAFDIAKVRACKNYECPLRRVVNKTRTSLRFKFCRPPHRPLPLSMNFITR